MAWPENSTSALAERQRLAGGEADLLADEIDSGDQLGHRVLDLQPRVHLDEVELAVLIEELDRAEAAIVQLAQRIDDHRAEPLALRRIERRRGRLLDHLLVSALQRAVALAQMDDVTAAVADHLHLDMARMVEEPLDIDPVVAERRARLAAGQRAPHRPARRQRGPRSCRVRRRRRPP